MLIRESRTTIKVRVATLRGYNTHQRLVVRDAKPTKFSRKRRAPVAEISGKNEPGREDSNEMELGADGKNDAIIKEPCKRVPAHSGAHPLIHGAKIATTAKVRKSMRKQFWYYEPIADDEPKPVDMMQRDEQLGKSGLEPSGILC